MKKKQPNNLFDIVKGVAIILLILFIFDFFVEQFFPICYVGKSFDLEKGEIYNFRRIYYKNCNTTYQEFIREIMLNQTSDIFQRTNYSFLINFTNIS